MRMGKPINLMLNFTSVSHVCQILSENARNFYWDIRGGFRQIMSALSLPIVRFTCSQRRHYVNMARIILRKTAISKFR